MNSELFYILRRVVSTAVICFLGSWWVGGLLESIKEKKCYAIGMYIPLVLVWIKYIIAYLAFI